MGFFSRLIDVFKAMANDGPDGAFQRFRVASQEPGNTGPPSRQAAESVLQSSGAEVIKMPGDVEARITQKADGWYYALIGGGVALFETGGPFPDRASLLRKLGISG